MPKKFDAMMDAGPEAPISTLRVKEVHVVVTHGPDVGKAARLEGPTFVVGSGPAADLRLADETVSREHLRLSVGAEGVHVHDLQSELGTWMGTVRIRDIVLVQSTSIVIGGTTLALSIEAEVVDDSLGGCVRFGAALADAAPMRDLFTLLERASRSDVSILIEGESGVGKDLLANGIHQASNRAAGPFVALDCGAIPMHLIESELFGHERGAFTGAERARDGAFVQASGGTLFLDEIGELPLEMQPKLLRVLEAREVRPLGSNTTRSVDVRIVSASNRTLSDPAKSGAFRRDLFYRLAVLRVAVPPLRERPDDILPLARSFLRRIPGYKHATLPAALEEMFLAYGWPGNVRELRNVVNRYTVLGPDPAVLFGDPTPETYDFSTFGDLSELPYREARAVALERFERRYIPSVLDRAGNVVVRAAALAGVRRASFHRMLQRIRITQESGKSRRVAS